MTDASPARAPRSAALIFIFVTVLLDMLAIGLIIPVLPNLVLLFEAGDTVSAAKTFGVFGTAWALLQFLCSPVLGSLSYRFGRRPVVLLSNLWLGLDYVLMALLPRLCLVLTALAVTRLTAAVVWPLFA